MGCAVAMLSACDPNDEFIDTLNAESEIADTEAAFYLGKTVLDSEYTLTDADYALSSDDGISGYSNFSSSATAADYLPEVLTNMMVYGETAVEYTVNYNYYRGSLSYIWDYLGYLEELDEIDSYELVDADYDSMSASDEEPASHNNFSWSTPAVDYLPDFLLGKYPDAVEGDELAVTYEYYDYGTSNVTEFWSFDGSVWAESDKTAPEVPSDVTVYELEDADYDSMGAPGNYNNFSGSDAPEDYLPSFLSIKFPYALEGSKVATVYKYYSSGSTDSKMAEYTLTDGDWVVYQTTITSSSVVAFKDKVWVVIPPIAFVLSEKTPTVSFTLTDEDYAFVGNDYYGNFDEDLDEIIEKIGKIIKNNYADLAVGDVYEVTYNYYNSGASVETMTLEAVEDN